MHRSLTIHAILKNHVLIAGAVLLLRAGLSFGQDFQLHTKVDLVVVPVSVHDRNGALAGGLKQDDFTILEDGRPQTISNFSKDSPPISAAIVVDTGMCGTELHRLISVQSALARGFRESDEAAVYRYDKFVTKLSDFTTNLKAIATSFDAIAQIAETKPADCAGMTLGLSPLHWLLDRTQIGSIGAPPTPATPNTTTAQQPTGTRPPPTSRVLHDAVFTAATDLGKLPNNNRKIVILISDGQVAGTNEHSEGEAAEKLLRSNIQFYAVGADLKMFQHLATLSSYAKSTGGAVFGGGTEGSMMESLGKLIDQAHDQYVLGYVSDNEISGSRPVFRKIEVKTRDPKLKTTHRQGYLQYP